MSSDSGFEYDCGRVDPGTRRDPRYAIIDSEGGDDLRRTEATRAGTPTVTVEMGEALRVQDLIDDVLGGVESVFAEYELREASAVRWPGWRTVIRDTNERTWIRADVGGIVDIHRDSGSLVSAGARVCTLRIRSKATASPSKPRLPGC